jgi:hypothetical protein
MLPAFNPHLANRQASAQQALSRSGKVDGLELHPSGQG